MRRVAFIHSADPVGEYEIANVLWSTCFLKTCRKRYRHGCRCRLRVAVTHPPQNSLFFVGIFPLSDKRLADNGPNAAFMAVIRLK
jgi:hypothetical protein